MSLSPLYDQRYATGYRDKLEGYETARWAALQHFIKRVLTLNDAQKVLDYGAGAGLHVNLWETVFPTAELHFCDISAVAREKFALKFPQHVGKYRLLNDDLSDTNENTFDVVVSVEVMEHVEDLSGYLRDIYGLLKPGGYFIWTTPCANRFSVEHVLSALLGKIDNTPEGYKRWSWEDPTHLRRLRSDQAAERLKSIGFSDIRFRFRSHFFSFVCTYFPTRYGQTLRNKLMKLDYLLFRRLPNGASMIGCARKGVESV